MNSTLFNKPALATATLLNIFSVSSHAALYAVDLDGIAGHDAVYDSVLDITWLADANYASSLVPGTPGRMDWFAAETLIASMNTTEYLGVTNWRQTTNSGCQAYLCGRPANSIDNDPSTDTDPATDTNALHDTDDELGYHYYRNFEAAAGGGMINGSNTANLALFNNIQGDEYWTGTEQSAVTAYRFNNWGQPSNSGNAGSYGSDYKTGAFSLFYVWPVADGNVGGASVVPLPAAAWLFGSAVAGLGLLRRRTSLRTAVIS